MPPTETTDPAVVTIDVHIRKKFEIELDYSAYDTPAQLEDAAHNRAIEKLRGELINYPLAYTTVEDIEMGGDDE